MSSRPSPEVALRSRRRMLQGLALLLAPGLGATLDFPANAAEKQPLFVFVFLRGALDGLSAIPPYKEPRYYALRSDIGIAPPGSGEGSALDLDGRFGLHPALAPLLGAYRAGELCVVNAVGLRHDTRSHFEAQDFVELGTPGSSVGSGWLARLLAPRAEAAGDVPALALEESLPRSLYGFERTFTADGLASLRTRRDGPLPHAARQAFNKMYGTSRSPDRVERTGAKLFELLQRLEPLLEDPPRARYPEGAVGARFADVARLVRARIGSVFTLSLGGWDTHHGQGGARGVLARRLGTLAESLTAFRQDLGADFARTVTLLVTEFGRTVGQNGTHGTDHGHGSVAFLFGGPVRGGQVHGHWPGLADAALHQGRDLAITTDFRDVFATIAERHLGASAAALFPGYAAVDARLPILR